MTQALYSKFYKLMSCQHTMNNKYENLQQRMLFHNALAPQRHFKVKKKIRIVKWCILYQIFVTHPLCKFKVGLFSFTFPFALNLAGRHNAVYLSGNPFDLVLDKKARIRKCYTFMYRNFKGSSVYFRI